MNRSNVAFDDDRVGRQLPSICRPMAWERRRPYSANYPVDDYRLDDDMGAVSRTCLYQHSRHVPQRSRDDLFCHRPPVDSSRHLLEVAYSYTISQVQYNTYRTVGFIFVLADGNKKLSYRREAARCLMLLSILVSC